MRLSGSYHFYYSYNSVAFNVHYLRPCRIREQACWLAHVTRISFSQVSFLRIASVASTLSPGCFVLPHCFPHVLLVSTTGFVARGMKQNEELKSLQATGVTILRRLKDIYNVELEKIQERTLMFRLQIWDLIHGDRNELSLIFALYLIVSTNGTWADWRKLWLCHMQLWLRTRAIP